MFDIRINISSKNLRIDLMDLDVFKLIISSNPNFWEKFDVLIKL